MDNICHTLVGAAVAQAGLKRRTSLAMSTAVISANLPDIDVLVFLSDAPSVAFRRGITHGLPAQILLPLAFAGLMWWIARRRAATRPTAHFGWLLAISYIGIFTHVFLDFLNTYGIRLLSPLSPRWFYGDAVFIVDPWLWLVLGAGAWLARRRGGRPAAAALIIASLYIGAMLWSARAARAIVHDAWVARTGEAPRALMVGPRPVTPFRKQIIVDAGDRYVAGAFDWLPVTVTFEEEIRKQAGHPAVSRARLDPDVRGLLVWSRFPVWHVRDVPDGGFEVQLRDMRFRNLTGRGGFAASVIVSRD